MSLVKHGSIIGGLTLVSRIFGFARDMLLARTLGAGLAADAYQLAFIFPNTFRRLFAEGAFSVAFIPMYSRKLAGENGEEEAEKFANDTLSVFIWVLLVFCAIIMAIMPWIDLLLAGEYREVPGKFELAVFLSRVTFPYLGFISIVAMLSGLLNARSRFAPGAVAPVVFNLVLIGAIVLGDALRANPADDRTVAITLSAGVSVSGFAQMLYLWWAVRRAGLKLRIQKPRITPDMKRLMTVILPATFGAGIYQISQFVDTFFATSLPQGSLTLLKMADRLNQMPLGIVGIALGTAILPMLSRHIQQEDSEGAQRLQTSAVELCMLLTLPAAAALAICAPAFVTAFFVGGKFTAADGAIMADIVVALVAGLPAYVLVKVLNPSFFSRSDTRTPVWTALVTLIFNIVLNIIVVTRFGIVGLAAATAASATLNCVLLYFFLHRRDWFRVRGALFLQLLRQLVAVAAMSGALYFLMRWLAPYFGGSVFDRIWSLALLVGAGAFIYFATGYITGAIDRQRLNLLVRKRRSAEVSSGS